LEAWQSHLASLSAQIVRRAIQRLAFVLLEIIVRGYRMRLHRRIAILHQNRIWTSQNWLAGDQGWLDLALQGLEMKT